MSGQQCINFIPLLTLSILTLLRILNLTFDKHSSSSEDVQRCTLIVKNKMGVHARPAAMIVRAANKYATTEVLITKEDQTVNAKSIMGLMMLAASQGTKLLVQAEGPDAQHILNDLKDLFERGFEEN